MLPDHLPRAPPCHSPTSRLSLKELAVTPSAAPALARGTRITTLSSAHQQLPSKLILTRRVTYAVSNLPLILGDAPNGYFTRLPLFDFLLFNKKHDLTIICLDQLLMKQGTCVLKLQHCCAWWFPVCQSRPFLDGHARLNGC